MLGIHGTAFIALVVRPLVALPTAALQRRYECVDEEQHGNRVDSTMIWQRARRLHRVTADTREPAHRLLIPSFLWDPCLTNELDNWVFTAPIKFLLLRNSVTHAPGGRASSSLTPLIFQNIGPVPPRIPGLSSPSTPTGPGLPRADGFSEDLPHIVVSFIVLCKVLFYEQIVS